MSDPQNIVAPFHPNVKDLTGQKFGKLTVKSRSHKDIHRNIHWLCQCECGVERSVCGLTLRQGRTQSCGCATGEWISQSKITVNLIQQKFGRLTVLLRMGRKSAKERQTVWKCRCECGAITFVPTSNLTSGNSKSCGCLQRELLSIRQTIHGLNKPGYRTRVYNIWNGIKSRCDNPNNHAFHHYGGRGIKMCEGWRDPAVFGFEMGEPPPRNSIDRINNEGHYSCGRCLECLRNEWPMNCRWATRAEQARNKRGNRNYTLNGETKCVRDWEKIALVTGSCIVHRIEKLGWSVHDALFTPRKPGNHTTRKLSEQVRYLEV